MEFSTEFWANHRKGQETKTAIVVLLCNNQSFSLSEISIRVGRCSRQVRRHLHTLMSEGKVIKLENGCFSAPEAGKYLGNQLKK